MQTLNQLIEKYNRPGPRYTSYPPVPFWRNAPKDEEWIGHIKKTYSPEVGVDLYIHVPYCESLCYYCGCNRTITKNHNVEDPFLEMLLKEWDLYCDKLGFIPKINSLHFGGGTPTFLSPENLKKLIGELTKKKSDSFIGSIEIDPRTCTEDHLKNLSLSGITRVSLGIQDFDQTVQEAIHRSQSVRMVEELMQKLRHYNFKSINFDLIYGLPKQTISSISSTIETVAKMGPDLIAFYGYAHLPGRIKNQRLIRESDLPLASVKRELYETGKSILKSKGYADIGMDHFALPGSYLYEAKEQRKLHRNFMGYVDKKSSVLIGLGPTSISDSSVSFVQNAKEMSSYEEKLKLGILPLETGHTHSEHDLIVQKMVQELMCDGETTLDDKLPYWKEIKQELLDFQNDGIITLEKNQIRLSDLGKAFMRNVAMSFDFHLREQETKVKFSQTV